MDRLRQAQTAAFWIAVAAAIFGLLAATGHSPFPPGDPRLLPVLHPLAALVGAGFGVLTRRRQRAIDRQRWDLVADGAITKGERQYAHREAEAEMARTGVVLVAAPLLLAGWIASQFRGGGVAADLLPLSALLGFGLGLLASWWGERRGRRPPRTTTDPLS